MFMNKLLSCLLLSVSVFGVLVGLSGCSSSEPDVKVETARLQKAEDMRSYFDKVKGDYSALSEADHKQYVSIFAGDETKAKKTWDMMKYGPGGAPAGQGN